jgi:hypothetical protein
MGEFLRISIDGAEVCSGGAHSTNLEEEESVNLLNSNSFSSSSSTNSLYSDILLFLASEKNPWFLNIGPPPYPLVYLEEATGERVNLLKQLRILAELFDLICTREDQEADLNSEIELKAKFELYLKELKRLYWFLFKRNYVREAIDQFYLLTSNLVKPPPAPYIEELKRLVRPHLLLVEKIITQNSERI